MFIKYVLADLLRNPRRTLSTTVGVLLGIGLFCAVLFFIDGLSASMTQRAVAPLPIDMQRVLTQPVAGDLRLHLTVQPSGPVKPGDLVTVVLQMINQGKTPANEVVIRSALSEGLVYRPGSATADGLALDAGPDNPFDKGLTKAGLNIGTLAPGASVALAYQATVGAAGTITMADFVATFSTREAVFPIAANAQEPVRLAELAAQLRALDGVAFAEQLSFADLGPGAIAAGSALAASKTIDGPARVFGFDAGYVARDKTVRIVEGAQVPGAAMISAETAAALSVGVGDWVSLALPDGSRLQADISGIVDLTQARSLFASRRGADFETFLYMPYTIIISSTQFATDIVPAFERATTARGARVKAPPVREVDIGVQRGLLEAEPGVALAQTEQIARAVSAVAGGQDFLLDNISNTLAVARDDAALGKRMFVFLGAPGAMLAAMLAAYAGMVLGGAQRRERATLRMRGASRRQLLAMLVLRVSCITAAGAVAGVALGYGSAALVIGHATLTTATFASLLQSALIGALVGLVATGAALYLTGWRSIDREINEDRARLWQRMPIWRRWYLDLVAIAAVSVATAMVVGTTGFEGTPGSVYIGQAVSLPLALLVLPLGVWVAGSFFGGRLFAWGLAQVQASGSSYLNRPLALLYWSGLHRRSQALVDVAIILGLIVALATSVAVFTASYDGAKTADARYTVGSDARVTPSPASERVYRSSDAALFAVEGAGAVVPVVYGVHNVILRSKRTSDPANMAALDPLAYAQVATFDDAHFSNGSAAKTLRLLADRPDAVLVSTHMAGFLKAKVGDTLRVLLARSTSQQVEVPLEIIGLFDRLPGFPEGADALMNLQQYETIIAATVPAFFLVQSSDPTDAVLGQMAQALVTGPGADGMLRIDTRRTALAKDQSSLAALNIAGLLHLDASYALAMGTVTVAIFVFGLMMQRRREYVTLRALGMQPTAIRALIAAEAGTAALAGCGIGVPVGLVMAYYLINVLRPLFVLNPPYIVPVGSLGLVVGSILVAAAVTSLAASSMVNRLHATELLRDE